LSADRALPGQQFLGIAYASLVASNRRIHMQNEGLAKLIEEMIDLKIRQHAASTAPNTLKTPELAMVIAATKMNDHKRLEQLRNELTRLMTAEPA
jgi:hypothetical protein